MGPTSYQLKFSHFEFDPVQDLLGEGPLSEVYKATDTNLGRTVALKILRPHAEIDPEADTRFAREAKHTSSLDHPNIATIYEYGVDSGRAFIAMEYCQGRTLDKVLHEQKQGEQKLSIEESLRIALQLTGALTLVHKKGLIHRDLKPANIMLQHDGNLKLLDFGICRATGEQTITQHGMLVGTVLYMSPEQVRGDDIAKPSDIFALGAVLYHAMSGQLPFPGESFPEVCMSILDANPRPLSEVRSGFPKPIESFVMRCLAKSPEERFADAGEAHGALMAIGDVMLTGTGSVRGNQLTGKLALPPMRLRASDESHADLVAGVRSDLHKELSRSTGLQIELLADSSIPPGFAPGFLVNGTLEIEGHLCRLDLVIEHCPNGKQDATKVIWKEHIEHDDDDEWALQDQIVRSAARSIRRRVSEHSLTPVEQGARNSEAARKLSRRGQEVLHRGMTRHLLASITLFRRALEEDPFCGLAYAGLAESLVRKYLYWDGDDSFLGEARESARKALALDPDCAEAHTSLGFLYHMTGHLIDAQREYRLAIQINKDEWLAHRLLGALLSRQGNYKEASPLLQRAIGLRRKYISTYDHIYTVLQRLDRYEEAITAADQGIGEARRQLKVQDDDQDARLHLALLLARMGRRDEALQELEQASERGPKDGFTSFNTACVHALLGNLTDAVEALAAAQKRGFYIKAEIHNPELDILRGVPAFEALAL